MLRSVSLALLLGIGAWILSWGVEAGERIQLAFWGDKENSWSQNRAAKNLSEGRAFLKKNARKEGVVTTRSGLQYMVLRPGEGQHPTATDQVEVHYEGRFLSGRVFDSSYKRGKPAVFPLNRVIRGWTEGIQYMQVGSRMRLFIPSNLAYGVRGTGGGRIPGNATLIFDVELLGIK